MGAWFHHWIYEDIWIPVWPNWFAALPPAVWGARKFIKWDRARQEQHRAVLEHHKDLMEHIAHVKDHLGLDHEVPDHLKIPRD